jgi:hypothetical protein
MAIRGTLPAVLSLAALGGVVALATGSSLESAPSCEIFPRDNPWNQRVDSLPVAKHSSRLISTMGRRKRLLIDPSFPYTTVGGDQRKVPVSFFYRKESDRGPYPIPPDAPVESNVDHHVLVVDRDNCKLYELYKARRIDGGKRWEAGAGATWDLRSNKLRPKYYTSADAAGLPMLAGLVRYDEVQRGEIDHAIRFTASRTRNSFVYPARHTDGYSSSRRLPPMGLRVRLKRSYDISGFPPQTKVIMRALQQYGMILADTGGPWYISGATSKGWDYGDIESLGQIRGRDFEVVNTRSLPRPGL